MFNPLGGSFSDASISLSPLLIWWVEWLFSGGLEATPYPDLENSLPNNKALCHHWYLNFLIAFTVFLTPGQC